ncbi:hypothetical protein Q1695_006192 [Nippostrongylus brasiliensis]|nr:hypothetical protein Q1695_006192 [Nippostrongylus brasiliensis]
MRVSELCGLQFRHFSCEAEAFDPTTSVSTTCCPEFTSMLAPLSCSYTVFSLFGIRTLCAVLYAVNNTPTTNKAFSRTPNITSIISKP